MKTTRIAAVGTTPIIAVIALLLAAPAMATPQNTTLLTSTSVTSSSSTTNTQVISPPPALTVGQTLTFTSVSGEWRLLPGPNPTPVTTVTATTGSTGKAESGPASGTMVLTVTGVYESGYTLSLTSGTINLIAAASTGTTTSTTYTLGSGSAEMGPGQAHLVGQGKVSSATPGSVLFSAGAHARFEGQAYNTLHIDLEANGVEYGITLLVTAVVS